MIKRESGLPYLLLFVFIIITDRFTKWLALRFFEQPIRMNHFLRFELVFNRGISWGLFHSQEDMVFMMISVLIGVIILLLSVYTTIRWMNRQTIFGEVAILAGACSNMFDRVVYGGVIDFIRLSFNSWHWPVFNVADTSIVIGVFLMFWQQYKES